MEAIGDTQYQFVLNRLQDLAEMESRFWYSIKTEITNNLAFAEYPDIQRYWSMDPDSPVLPQLVSPKTDIFLNIPQHVAEDFAPMLRLMLGSILVATQLVEVNEAPRARRLILIDEASRLGAMDILENIRDRGRSIGLHLMMIYQDAGQIEKIWGQAGQRSWRNGCSAMIGGPVSDPKSAQDLSTMLGSKTIRLTTEGRSAQTPVMSGALGGSTSSSESEQVRDIPLISPTLISQLPGHAAIIATPGSKPILATKAIWFTRDDMKERVKGTKEIREELDVFESQEKLIQRLNALAEKKDKTADKGDAENAPEPEQKAGTAEQADTRSSADESGQENGKAAGDKTAPSQAPQGFEPARYPDGDRKTRQDVPAPSQQGDTGPQGPPPAAPEISGGDTGADLEEMRTDMDLEEPGDKASNPDVNPAQVPSHADTKVGGDETAGAAARQKASEPETGIAPSPEDTVHATGFNTTSPASGPGFFDSGLEQALAELALEDDALAQDDTAVANNKKPRVNAVTDGSQTAQIALELSRTDDAVTSTDPQAVGDAEDQPDPKRTDPSPDTSHETETPPETHNGIIEDRGAGRRIVPDPDMCRNLAGWVNRLRDAELLTPDQSEQPIPDDTPVAEEDGDPPHDPARKPDAENDIEGPVKSASEPGSGDDAPDINETDAQARPSQAVETQDPETGTEKDASQGAIEDQGGKDGDEAGTTENRPERSAQHQGTRQDTEAVDAQEVPETSGTAQGNPAAPPGPDIPDPSTVPRTQIENKTPAPASQVTNDLWQAPPVFWGELGVPWEVLDFGRKPPLDPGRLPRWLRPLWTATLPLRRLWVRIMLPPGNIPLNLRPYTMEIIPRPHDATEGSWLLRKWDIFDWYLSHPGDRYNVYDHKLRRRRDSILRWRLRAWLWGRAPGKPPWLDHPYP